MPLTEAQKEEYDVQLQALHIKLRTCANDITSLKSISLAVQTDPSKSNLFLAKLARGQESKEQFIQAWDRIVLVHIKLGEPQVFPSQDQAKWREEILDAFDLVKSVEILLKTEPLGPNANQARNNSTVNESSSSRSALLSHIRLPNFDGNIRSWVRYRDVFLSMVHNDLSLSPVSKFYLLRDSLSGEALTIVNKFDITDVNYELAWKSLNSTYDKPRVLAAAYLNHVLDFRMPSQPNLTAFQTFITAVADSVSAFRALKLENSEDKILALLALRTLDPQTRHKFELSHINSDFPSVDSVVQFVRNKCQALKLSDNFSENSSLNSRQSHPSTTSRNSKYPTRSSTKYTSGRNFYASSQDPPNDPECYLSSQHNKPSKPCIPRHISPTTRNSAHTTSRLTNHAFPLVCPSCKQPHILSRCPVFIGLSSDDRHKFLKSWNGCNNCLNPSHGTSSCSSKFNCRICNKRHHTLLHLTVNSQASPSAPEDNKPSQAVCGHINGNTSVILGTARALVKDPDGNHHEIRLFLDCGSQRSFVTERCANLLCLNVRPVIGQISGLGGTKVAEIHGITNLTLTPLQGSTDLQVTASVLSRITLPLPKDPVPEDIVCHFWNLNLADPHFYKPQEIDVLIGADFYDQVVCGTFQKIKPNLPPVLPTIFGLVIMGSYQSSSRVQISPSFHCEATLQDISSQLQAFWELEELPAAPRLSPEDAYCEDHFLKTHSRDASGRYIVRLPFAQDTANLGNNRSIACKRFYSLETRLSSNPDLCQDYCRFMEEYEELGHMETAEQPSPYVIPHFGIRQQKKLRVVFDGSCPSSTTSLNEMLHPGPKLQNEISSVLTHFRQFPVAITGDLVKMYRQVLIHPEDRRYQHIFWRRNPKEKLREIQLNTVTYGLTPGAFLAIRAVKQLIQDEGHKFPLANSCIDNGIYVDDIAVGADDTKQAALLCRELIDLFALGGFSISKWSSNVPDILPNGCHLNTSPLVLQPEKGPEIKVLGLIWNPLEDAFSYSIKDITSSQHSKRTVLSFISRIFDPLGFLAPIVFSAKSFLQDIWRQQLDWDDYLPEDLQRKWTDFAQSWSQLSQIRIPRYTQSRNASCNLIGFCDASMRGYAAAVYLQVEFSHGEYKVFLLRAKTRVAPARFVSIARLELCGALLLAKLISTIDLSPSIQTQRKILFTDSTITLAWIHSPSHLLKVFEANRASTINELVPKIEWRHVSSSENPADVASRGLLPSEISTSDIWWHGPSWLKTPLPNWPSAPFDPSSSLHLLADEGYSVTAASINHFKYNSTWIQRFSNLQILLRVVVRILRFARRSSYEFQTFHDPITPPELTKATHVCAKLTQKHYFPKGVDSPDLSALHPFLDEAGIIRVGGRLQNAPIEFSARHPILIPKKCHLAKLIIDNIHQKYFHAGPTLVLSISRTQFWIPSGMRLIKTQISKCISCFRRKPTSKPTIMAPLPSSRLTPNRPFLQTGVDYGGPFLIRDTLRRKPVLTKAYICLFVCFTTKALHLEAVSALTTEAFCASLDRFVARRGRPRTICSDNGTNFIGASRYLKDLSKFLVSQNRDIATHLSNSGVEWNFIPPRSPHFGGLWEAGIKSTKSLLLSSVGSQSLTFEEFGTILTRIEGVLNSRPLCPLSDDPESYDALTPGHFLIGAPLCSLPEEPLVDVPTNRLSRWQQVQRSVQLHWSRWRLEYLNTLQQRNKWRKKEDNISINDLVVLLEKKSPCGVWPLARVTDIHPGPDGQVRVVTVKTSSGHLFKRSAQHVARLPSPDSSQS